MNLQITVKIELPHEVLTACLAVASAFLNNRDSPRSRSPAVDEAAAGEVKSAAPPPDLPPARVVTAPAVFSGVPKGRRPGETVWTEARKQQMRQLRQCGVTFGEVKDALNALPGAEIASANAVSVAFRKFFGGGAEPVQVKAAPVPAAPMQAAPQVAPVRVAKPVMPAGPLKVTPGQARAWAAERGLCNGAEKLDIEKVNTKRSALGVPVFELVGRV
jgi:hypothetical protein